MKVRLAGEDLAWTELFASAESSPSWSHSGIAVSGDGEVVVASPEGDALVFLGRDGSVRRRVATGTTDLHSIVRDVVDGEEWFWVADHGHKFVPARPVYEHHRVGARLFAVAADGSHRLELHQPEHPAYATAPWSPTSIAVEIGSGADDRRYWVADGYGASLVHCYDAAGRCLFSVDGSGTGLTFDCPHGIVLDPRGERTTVVVADRANQRLVELELDGTFVRTVGEGHLWSPSSLVVRGAHLVVTELWGDVVVLDLDGTVVDRFVEQRAEPARPGWPNAMDGGAMVRPQVRPGEPNSPHGIAVDPADDSLLFTEWFIGGRVVRLSPVPAT